MSAADAGSSPGDYPPAVRRLLEAGRLRAQPMQREHVAALWRKAVNSGRDAALPGMSVDGALRSAYEAGHLAALSLLAAHGLRTGSGQGHHEVAFAAAAALGHAGLDELVADSMEVRSLRKGAMYDPVLAGPDDRDRALAWMRRALPAVRAALSAVDAGIAPLLEPGP